MRTGTPFAVPPQGPPLKESPLRGYAPSRFTQNECT